MATPSSSGRVGIDGRFFRIESEKFHVKGVTYGPFAPNDAGDPLPNLATVRKDFQLMQELGVNTLRIYHTPPKWLLDEALAHGLRVFLDVAWPKNLVFTDDPAMMDIARRNVRDAARACGNHPAMFALSVVNELPADVVRYIGAAKVELFIDELVAIAKRQAPELLVTFANYPPTEYLQPRSIDFVCFNVYLHDETAFRNYLVRLQHAAGEKPLMLGEYGIDTIQEKTEPEQADILVRHVKAVFEEGLAGTFIFSFTDDWHVHGYQIEDWAFGLVTRDRKPKLAFEALRHVFATVPHTFDPQSVGRDKLPKVSVIICSYNGASTVESCLRSMQKIDYPNFEVVFVDDGSKDNTQEILARFGAISLEERGTSRLQVVSDEGQLRDEGHLSEYGHVRDACATGPQIINIKQTNHGLSHARNVGLHAAEGEIVVYTDSDCEADEDWLYHMVTNLLRSSHVGMGGPNLIPDEGSWVADCVGLSPGGPTHVMINDREAEHVPGCNMGYYKWAALQINGFDPQFRSAGDDVDFIWRLQADNFTIGYAPAAQVWHYRRNSVKAYLKQQRGYGSAEAMLKFKHPDKFNTLGASHWRGRIYGGDGIGVRFGGDTIYHGLFGTGLFQTIYRRPASLPAAMMTSLEWHGLTAFVAALGFAWPVLFYWAGAMALIPLVLSFIAAYQAPAPRHENRWSKLLMAYLHWRQPIVRGIARYGYRLTQKRIFRTRNLKPQKPLPWDKGSRRGLKLGTLLWWHHQLGREQLLPAMVGVAREAKLNHAVDSGWNGWDLELYGSRYVKVRAVSVTEKHGEGLMTKVKLVRRMTTFALTLFVASLVAAIAVSLRVWPYGWYSWGLPAAVWLLYAWNAMRVARPSIAVVDRAARDVGFYPVLPKRKAKAVKAAHPAAAPKPALDDVDAEDVEAAVA